VDQESIRRLYFEQQAAGFYRPLPDARPKASKIGPVVVAQYESNPAQDEIVRILNNQGSKEAT
jgi:hypothetical protein